MFKTISKFAKSEDGAITVDWVVLTAGIAFLGLAVIYLIGAAATDKSDNIGAFIGEQQIAETF